jgi:uncharacterized protein
MTIQENIISALKSLKPELSEKFGVHSMGVFGSVTRNDFSPDRSDVDIIVDFSRPIGIEFIDLAEYLEKRIWRKIDLISRKGVKKRYLEAIEKDIIYV